jgi:fructosamine-3-kinase
VLALGHGLARVHLAGAEAFGGEGPLRIGRLELPNGRLERWSDFYAQRRLLPLIGPAGLGERGRRAVERLCGRLGDLAGPEEPPARLHGDLWAGNVLAGRDGRPWLIDPVAHGGHREVDLAMLELFGGPAIRAPYGEVAPLAAGWEDRVALWQLFPLLVHAALFGGSYAASAERIAVRYAGHG